MLTKPLPLHRRVWRATRAFVRTPRPRMRRAVQVMLVLAVPLSLWYSPLPAAVLVWVFGLTIVGGALLNIPVGAVRVAVLFLHMAALAAFEVVRVNLSGTPWPIWQPGLIVPVGLAAGYLPVKYALARYLSSPRASRRARDLLDALAYNDDEARFPTIRRREMPERTPIGFG